jgi:hypothetical protein
MSTPTNPAKKAAKLKASIALAFLDLKQQIEDLPNVSDEDKAAMLSDASMAEKTLDVAALDRILARVRKSTSGN